MESTRRKVIIRLLLITGLSVSAGFALGILTAAAVFRAKLQGFIDLDPAERRERVVWYLTRDLNLTPAQSAQLGALLATNQGELIEIRRSIAPRINMLLDRTMNEATRFLDTDQHERLKIKVATIKRRIED